MRACMNEGRICQFWGEFLFPHLFLNFLKYLYQYYTQKYAMEHSAMPKTLNLLETRNIAYGKSSFFTGPVPHNSSVSSVKSSAGLDLLSQRLTKPIPFLISPTANVNLCPPAHQPSQ